MGAVKRNYIVVLLLLAINLLGLLMLVFGKDVASQSTLALIFLLISIIVAFGAFIGLHWAWKVASLYFLLYLINLLFLFVTLRGEKLFIAAMALIAAFGFMFSVMNIGRVAKPQVEVVHMEKKSTSKAPKKKYSPGKFVASATGTVYHAPKCDWAKRINKKNQVWLKDKAEARKKGYKQHSCLKK